MRPVVGDVHTAIHCHVVQDKTVAYAGRVGVGARLRRDMDVIVVRSGDVRRLGLRWCMQQGMASASQLPTVRDWASRLLGHAATVVQRAFREAISDPSRALCRQRLLREHAEL